MDLEHYQYTVALHTDDAICFIAYLSYMLQFLDGHIFEKQNLEINLLQIYEGGLNSGESWLCFCVF